MTSAADEYEMVSALEGATILVLANGTYQFHERYAIESKALIDAGAQLDVLYRSSTNGCSPFARKEFFPPLGMSSRLPASNHSVRSVRIASNVLRNVVRSVVRSVLDPLVARNLRRNFIASRAKEYDIIWALDFDNLYDAVLAKGRSSAAVVYETIDLVPEYHHLGPLHRWRSKRIERSYIGHIDGFVTSCESYADYYVESYGTVPGFRRPVVRDNFPASHVSSTTPSGRRLKLLFLGALTFDRPIKELIEAAALTTTDFELTLMGHNFLGAMPARLVAEHGLSRKVRIEAPCSGADVVEVAAKYDVGIVALRGDNENERRASTSKLFTYIASGLAVIGTDLPGVALIVARHSNGVLVPTMNPVDWSKALDALCNTDRKVVDAMKERSVTAAREYSWNSQRPLFVAEFRRALSERRRYSCADQTIDV